MGVEAGRARYPYGRRVAGAQIEEAPYWPLRIVVPGFGPPAPPRDLDGDDRRIQLASSSQLSGRSVGWLVGWSVVGRCLVGCLVGCSQNSLTRANGDFASEYSQVKRANAHTCAATLLLRQWEEAGGRLRVPLTSPEAWRPSGGYIDW